jgi:hypothetical protein
MVIPSTVERFDMYTGDMTLAEAYSIRRALLKEKWELEKMQHPIPEQLLWDLEDVSGIIFILTA